MRLRLEMARICYELEARFSGESCAFVAQFGFGYAIRVILAAKVRANGHQVLFRLFGEKTAQSFRRKSFDCFNGVWIRDSREIRGFANLADSRELPNPTANPRIAWIRAQITRIHESHEIARVSCAIQ